MSWLGTLGVSLITGVIGCFGAGLVATFCVRWYRISSFEGGSGYYVIGISLLGIVVGLIVGIVCAQIVASWEGAGFMKGLGVSSGTMAGLVFVSGLLAWAAADLAPEINGHSLELQIEVRGPKNFVVPPADEKYAPFAGVYLPRGRSQATADLRQAEATQVDGRWTVTATVPLRTSVAEKYLRVYFNQANDLTFPLRLRRHPTAKDTEWSAWVDSGWDAGKPEPAKDEKFSMRFRVTEVIPPPPGPTHEEFEARQQAEEKARFEAIPPSAPIADWFPYTQYGAREDRRAIAIGHMTSRASFVAELTPLLDDSDPEKAAEALRLIEHLPMPNPALLEPVAATGRRIAAFIRVKNTTTAGEDPSYLWAAEASIRFSAWMVAVHALREKSGGDFTPELKEILELSRIRDDSHCMRVDVRRVASYYMQQWAGLAPAPGDPPPR